MSLPSSLMRFLAEKGLSATDLVEAMEIYERDCHAMSRVTECDIHHEVTAEELEDKRRKAADRKRRQRERQKEMSRDVTNVTRDIAPPLSLPPSFPPYPPNNPPPAHPPVGDTRARGGKSKPKFDLPDDIPADEWGAYVEMRNRIKKPMTDHAKELAVKELRKLAAQGHDPPDVLNQSTLNSWQGLFALKDQRNGRTNSYRDGRSAWVNDAGTGLGGIGDGDGFLNF